MGGLAGQIKARTKDELWHKFNEDVQPEAVDRFGLYPEVPSDQAQAFERMWWDANSQRWVLDFYFGK
jgi:hypothetical protein